MLEKQQAKRTKELEEKVEKQRKLKQAEVAKERKKIDKDHWMEEHSRKSS